MNKKVTIGIPVYNEVAFIRHTLMSALEQGTEQIALSHNATSFVHPTSLPDKPSKAFTGFSLILCLYALHAAQRNAGV